MTSRAKDMAQLKKSIQCKHKNLTLLPITHSFNRLGMVVHTYNPSREVEID